MRKLFGVGMIALAITIGSATFALADLEAGKKAHGIGDFPTALKEFRLLAKRGDATAQYLLGSMYDFGEGVVQNHKEALNWYRKAADQGDPSAQQLVATMYEDGSGVTQNYNEAMKWYRKAADQGDAGAQFRLGFLGYAKGQGVTQNYNEAMKWYRKAADQGHVPAQVNLGLSYARGQGVALDYVQAHKWFSIASFFDSEIGSENRNIAAQEMSHDEISTSQSLVKTWKLNHTDIIWKRMKTKFDPNRASEISITSSSGDSSISNEQSGLIFAMVDPRPDDIAVIIGNANYKKLGKDIPNVDPAYSDAEGFKQWVTQAKGVREGNIIFLKDATGSQMENVFGNERSHKGQLFNWTKRNKSKVYIYYAGHGAPAGDGSSAFLVPSDSNSATIELTGYPLATLYKNLRKLPAKSITVVLESCFSGTSQSGNVISRTSGILVSPKLPSTPKNITVISAGRANQIASWEQDSSHGLFTKYFLTGMTGEADKSPYGNGDGEVSYKELGKYLDGTMTYYARRYYGRDQNAQIVTSSQ